MAFIPPKKNKPVKEETKGPLSKAGTDFALSHSAATTFGNCRRKFYYQYIEGLELKFLNTRFLLGGIIGVGISHIYGKRKDFVEVTLREFKQKLKQARKQYVISAEQEQELAYMEVIIEAMLIGYAEKHKKFIAETEWMGSEVKLDYVTPKGTHIYGKMDNRLKYQGKMYVHELKTSKYINNDYVQNIKNDPQTALYMPLYNMTHTDKIHGIVYDVIMKPSIRQKQNESKESFIDRLLAYYMANDEKKFYMEIITRPLISPTKIFNVYDNLSQGLKMATEKEHFYENFDYCHVWNKCEFYDLCFKGENSATLSAFKKSEWRGKRD